MAFIYANMRDLKERTAQVMSSVDKGKQVIITYRGYPRALMEKYNEKKFKKLLLRDEKRRTK